MNAANSDALSLSERVRRAWRFWAVAYTFIVMMAGTNIATPLYKGYEAKFGVGPLTVTVIFAVYVAALVPSLLFVGPLSDSIGVRRVVLPAIALAVLGAGVGAAADSILWLIVSRVLQGVAIGAVSGALTASLVESEPDGDQGRASMVGALAPNAGTGLGPLLAGILAQYAPGPMVLSYLVEIGLLLAAAVVAIRIPDRRPRGQWRPSRPQVPNEIRSTFAAGALTATTAFAVVGLFLSLVPSLAHTPNLAVIGAIVGLLFAACIIAQRLTYHRPAIDRQTGGLPLLTLGLILLIVASAMASLAWLLVATVVAGVGLGLAFSGALSQVNDVAPSERRAEVASSFYVAVYLGLGVPTIGVGLLSTAIGLTAAVQYFAVVAGALCLIRLTALLVHRASRAPVEKSGEGNPRVDATGAKARA